MLVIKAQDSSFCTTNNVHSTPINAKDQVMLELVNPTTLWSLWKCRCRRVFCNRTVHRRKLLQEIWSEVCSHTKEPIQWHHGQIRWSRKIMISLHPSMVELSLSWSSPFLESMGLHIRWNYRVPFGICI